MNNFERSELFSFLRDKGMRYDTQSEMTQCTEKLEGSYDLEKKLEANDLHCSAGYTWTKQDWGHSEFTFYRCEGGHHLAYFIKEDLGRDMVKLPNGEMGYAGIGHGDMPDDTPMD